MTPGDRLIVFDLETGGLDPGTETRAGHPVIQFAAVAVDHEWSELEALEVKVLFDERTAEQEALVLNGYDRDTWAREGLSAAVARGRIADFMRRHATMEKVSKRTGRPYTVAAVCGHNADRFDSEFLALWFKRSGEFLPAACYEGLDTLQLSRWAAQIGVVARPENHKLETLCRALGVPHGGPHEALSDVRACAAVARELCSRMAPQVVTA